MKKWIAMVLLVMLMLSWNGREAQAATATVSPVYTTHANDHTSSGYVYSDQSSKKVTINISANQGFIIKSLRWETEDGRILREVPGFWAGKESFTGEDTISGTSVMVKTVDSHTWGGIYYWDRSGGSNLWRATASNVRYENSSTCPSAPVDQFGLKAYPNCTDDMLSLKLTKEGAYHVGGTRSGVALPDKVVDLSTVRPVDIIADRDKRIENSVHGGVGYTDPTTRYLGRFDVEAKNSIRVYYQQTFGDNSINQGYYKDWANPGARQMWWYAAFTFRLEATTYQYKDKQLIVEWMPKENEFTTLNVRHMVRTGSTGSFTKAAESVTPLAEPLPHSRTVSADTSYGKVVGRNVSYSQYSNTVQTGNSVTVNLSSAQKSAYVTFFYEVTPPAFTGDFDIIPDTINYRESFALKPKDFVMNGCTYQSHRYKIERSGTFTTSPIVGQNTTTSYSYSNYPWVIGVGSHTVSINIKTSCGESGWINHKTLTVNDMAGNRPPKFQIGFVFPEAQTRPVHEVVEGTVMNLIYIEDPSVPTPIDPDGDLLHFMGFDTENGTSFIRSLPQRYSDYTNGYHGVVMDTLGYHYVSAQMRDQWGLATSASTYINVVPKNPVPLLYCPPVVKSGRNVNDTLFDASRSYSPAGRSIDHSRNEWTNKKTVYINDTELNIIETVELNVYDNTGLKSLNPGVCRIIVEPDQPPVAKLEVPNLAVRDQEIDIYNRSYSPDNDKIVKAEYKYKYDAANDGFDNDNWRNINTNSLLSFSFNPSKVGKYLFYVKVTEDFGLTDDTSDEPEELLTLDVINDSPTISFNLEGKNEQPDLDPPTPYTPEIILSQWKLYEVNRNVLLSNGAFKWNVDGDKLSGSTGKLGEDQSFMTAYPTNWVMPFQDMGYGRNSLSPYRAISALDTTKTQLLLDVQRQADTTYRYIQFQNSQPMVKSNETMFYITGASTSVYASSPNYTGLEFFAFNKSKIGRYQEEAINETGMSLYFKQSYPDGDPIEFRLTPKRLMSETQKYNTYHYPSYEDYLARTNGTLISDRGSFSNFNIVNYFVSDRTVYQLVYFTKHENYLDTYMRNGVKYEASNYEYDLRTYDAFTGEFIASTLNGTGMRSSFGSTGYTKRDHLVLRSGDTFHEIDRYGREVAINTLPQLGISLADSNFEIRRIHQEYNLGSYYIVSEVGLKSNYNYSMATYLSKINPDFTLGWTTKLQGDIATARTSLGYQGEGVKSGHPHLVFNPLKNEVLVNTFSPNGFGIYEFYDRINLNTGTRTTWNTTLGKWNSFSTQFSIGWDGEYKTLSGSTTYPPTRTAEGWSSSSMSNRIEFKDSAGSVRTSGMTNKTLWMNIMFAATTSGYTHNGMYVGDGMYLTFNGYADAYNNHPYANIPVLLVGQPTTDPIIYDLFTLGQFVSDTKLPNANLSFSMTMHQPAVNNDMVGMSFRMSDPQNRFAFESDGKTAYLSKYVNGVRTVLDSNPFIAQPSKSFDVRIQFVGDSIKVWINNVPFFDETDSTYEDGFFGMFSDKGLVDFANLGSKTLEAQDQWSTQYAIWEEDEAAATVRTDNVLFEDPEDDPIAELGWSIFHTVRFINNQGLSDLHNKSIGDGDLLLDKVGDYKVALKGRDDPNPNYLMPEMTFDGYRKDSNEFVRNITVHRRPIADFDVVQRESDGLILWTDRSHDPDRYESATHYSDEDTGIDYRATKGILEKRYYYVTPAGEYVAEKIVSPQEVGQYEIGLAVKDEYGAWSNWAVRTLDVGKIAVPNTPPTPGFTKTHTTTYRGVTVTVNSTASDAEDGGREKLAHTYYVRNKTANSGETIRSNSRTSWTTTFNQLGTYMIRQFVEDSVGANAQTEQEVQIVNRKPVANLTVPASTNQNSPTKMTVLRPEFKWTYSDADSDRQQRYQVQIYRYGGVLLHDSDAIDGAEVTWVPGIDLPEKTNMYVQVRAHDGYEWGNWSAVRYFYIETNQPPTADFTWLPNSVYEGDTVTFRSIVSDPDQDTLSVRYELMDPSGDVTTYNYSLQPTGATYPTIGPSLRMLQVGSWHMRMTVNDGKAAAVVVNRTVLVQELGITGQVTHAEDWEKHRLVWNEKNPGQERSPSTFWAGERFVLSAQTTNTGTSTTRATRVDVSAVGVGMTQLESTNSLNWTGHIGNQNADKPLEKLSNGYYDFVFRVTYSNGIQKSTVVRITVAGHWSDYFKLHQSW